MEHKPRQYPVGGTQRQHYQKLGLNEHVSQIRRLLCNSMFHVSQVARAHTSALRGGFVTVIMRRFSLEPWLANIEKFQITEVQLVW